MHASDRQVGCGSGGEWSETKEWSSYKEMQVY